MGCTDVCEIIRQPVTCPANNYRWAYTKDNIGHCYDSWYGPATVVGSDKEVVAVRLQSPSFQANLQVPEFAANLKASLERIAGRQPKELFPGAVGLAEIVASAGLAVAGLPGIVQTIANLSQTVARDDMALNLSTILGSAGQILGGIDTSAYGNFSNVLATGLNIGSQLTAPTPSYATPATYGPVYSPTPMNTNVLPTPVMASAQGIVVGGRMITSLVAPILAKISGLFGKRVSLEGAMSMIRRMAKFLTSPAAIAVALGITVDELAQLITANASRKRRTMNPANGKALRRAARRIKSFHKMCGTIDLLKSRGRRYPSRSRCGTCKKSPCRC